jgi:putative protease
MSAPAVPASPTSAPASAASAAAFRYARPELLAPAGDWECARAAVENGADAIFFGLERFNARMRAHNFTVADLPELMAFLHRRGVRGYVTFNTLVFTDELSDAADYLRAIIAAGVDAAIVQDVGICRLIRRLSPDFPIHGSTQMTVTNDAGVAFARELGAELVVLARENSLKEIEHIQAAQRAALAPGQSPLPLEVFVHGALCVAYSGQCLTSESLGGRSANRGECAQACRLPYGLVSDGQPIDLGDRAYLLSPQDLSGLDVLPDLVRVGVASLKIEGRLKSAEYVASITRTYRRALDRVMSELNGVAHTASSVPPASVSASSASSASSSASAASAAVSSAVSAASAASAAPESSTQATRQSMIDDAAGPGAVRAAGHAADPSAGHAADPSAGRATHRAAGHPEDLSAGHAAGRAAGLTMSGFDFASARYELNMAFSRGLYTGWFRGIHNQELAHGRFGTKRGVFLGQVARVGPDHVALRLEAPAKPGDGVVFDAGKPADGEEGGRIYQLDTDARSGESVLRFGHGDLDFRKIRPGHRVWKTNDPALDRELRATFAGEKIRHTRPVRAEIHGHAGSPLALILDDGLGHVVRESSTVPLEAAPADQRPLSTERLREQLGRLGGTPFHLGELENRLEGAVMLPTSELNRLRREAASRLEALRAAPKRWTLLAADDPSRRQSLIDLIPATVREPAPDAGAVQAAGSLPAGGAAGGAAAGAAATAQLIPYVRDFAQLDAALGCGVPFVDLYCEFENPKHYREAVQRFRAFQVSHSQAAIPGGGARPAAAIWLAPPRVFKPSEDWILKQVLSAEPDGILARNHEHLRFFPAAAPALRLRGDFSLNVANPLAAEYFLSKYKLERLTASYDLNVAQLESLLRGAPAAWFDLTLHQHMPMFHMEHCVFCAFLSKGKDYHDCGRPCEKHKVALRDRVGALLPLKADAGCRNTVFNPRAQTGAEFLDRFVALGARHFRVEFVDESADEVARTLRAYEALLAGRADGAELWRELKLLNQMGVTRGQLEAAPRVVFKKR